MAPIDFERARQETPGCKNVLHFNNAGSALPPQQVLDAVINHLTLESNIGGYEAFDQNLPKIERFYDAAAKLLGCGRDEIAFTDSATRAWDMAFYSLPFQPGDRILTARAEYSSNYIAFLQIARKASVVIDVIPSDESGQIRVDALEPMLDSRVKLIAVTHVPTNGGLVNPVAAVGRIARAVGIPFLVDACQSVGQMSIDVNEIGCDMLSATGRKFLRGPRGTGLLYVRKELLEQLEPPFLDMHSADWIAPQKFEMRNDARRFEEWEQYYAGKIGLAVAIDYALEWGLDQIRDRIYFLADRLRDSLSSIRGVTVHDLGVEKCGIVTFGVAGKDPDDIKRELAARKINVTVSMQTSTLLDMQARGIDRLVRASVHYYNTEEEIIRFCTAISGRA